MNTSDLHTEIQFYKTFIDTYFQWAYFQERTVQKLHNHTTLIANRHTTRHLFDKSYESTVESETDMLIAKHH